MTSFASAHHGKTARRVRMYEGSSMEEVLARVRGELGPRAVILQARRLWRRGLFGRRSPRGVRVAAGLPTGPAPEEDLSPTRKSRCGDGTTREAGPLHGLVDGAAEATGAAAGPLSGPLVSLRRRLLDAGLGEALARALIERVCLELGSGAADPLGARTALLCLLARMLPTSGPVKLLRGRSARVALIGPTGAGKTATIAKLAAHFRLKEGRSVGLVAADSHRVGAVEGLKAYAELFGLPMKTVRRAREAPRAVRELSGCDLILIDTAGCGQRDAGRLEELSRLLRALRADEVHLVIPLTAGQRNVSATVDEFVPLGADRLMFTKLDEAECMGALLRASARASRPVSYLSMSQAGRDGLRLAESRFLARLVLDARSALVAALGRAA